MPLCVCRHRYSQADPLAYTHNHAPVNKCELEQHTNTSTTPHTQIQYSTAMNSLTSFNTWALGLNPNIK